MLGGALSGMQFGRYLMQFTNIMRRLSVPCW